jgi:hypothetical protein
MGLKKAVETTGLRPQPRAIVVLGAGRSGTSAITRGLQTLGVELGDQLRPGGGKNPTGFFEDESLMKINKRLRKALGLRAESVSLIEPHQWQTPTVQAFEQEAKETIRRRFGAYSLWGYKYAGTLRLLPFWRRVFHSLALDVRYVMAVRNPISVAQSRAKLNPQRGTQEKSDLEWLVNVVPYFREVRERPFVVVDYDLVMADPVTQLERIATGLDLPLTATIKVAMQEYADQFLNSELRHNRFTDEDLDNNLRVNNLTRDAYRWLRRLATDEINQDSPQFWQDWSRIENALADLGPVLRYLDQVEADLRCAQRSALGPLQAVPQMWQNLRQNWSFTRAIARLRLFASDFRYRRLSSDT